MDPVIIERAIHQIDYMIHSAAIRTTFYGPDAVGMALAQAIDFAFTLAVEDPELVKAVVEHTRTERGEANPEFQHEMDKMQEAFLAHARRDRPCPNGCDPADDDKQPDEERSQPVEGAGTTEIPEPFLKALDGIFKDQPGETV